MWLTDKINRKITDSMVIGRAKIAETVLLRVQNTQLPGTDENMRSASQRTERSLALHIIDDYLFIACSGQ